MRNALAPRPSLPAVLGLAASTAPPGASLARGASARPGRDGPEQRPAAPMREQAAADAASCYLEGRCGQIPHREAQATTVCAPGGGHE
ncbi:hypothetical protein WMF04_30585 [Sorangium sp. So ce260]|uniref:hypothetical protein n=1 Tax=Sorangium sp. So ce260 TaxID=3133291 RepID=UPI003F648BA1